MSQYSVQIGDQQVDIELIEEQGTQWAVINGKRYHASLSSGETAGRYKLTIDEQHHPLVFEPAEKGYQLFFEGRNHDVSVERSSVRELRQYLKSSDVGGSGAGLIESHMPGLIVKVEIELGQRVEAGDSVLVIEAMKMENEIRSPIAGIVQSIEVKQGDEVSGGQTLCIISPEESNEQ